MKITEDALLGLTFMAIGLFALFVAIGYPMGTADRMGPGYLPVIISVMLSGIGATLVVRSRFVTSAQLAALPLRPILLVTLGIVLFGAVLKGLGMPLAVLVLVLVAATASLRFKLSVKAVAGAVAFSVACTFVFVTFLRMPIPIFGNWLQGIGP